MPFLEKQRSPFDDQPLDPIQFVIWEAPILGKRNWVKPELGDLPIPFNMNVRRFAPV